MAGASSPYDLWCHGNCGATASYNGFENSLTSANILKPTDQFAKIPFFYGFNNFSGFDIFGFGLDEPADGE